MPMTQSQKNQLEAMAAELNQLALRAPSLALFLRSVASQDDGFFAQKLIKIRKNVNALDGQAGTTLMEYYFEALERDFNIYGDALEQEAKK